MTENKKIYRSINDRKIAGVAAGLAEYFNIDPVIVRILFVFGFLLGGSGLILYIIFWAIFPVKNVINDNDNKDYEQIYEGETNMNEEDKKLGKNGKNQGSLTAGLILIAVGALFLIDRFVPHINFADLWPVILIVIGFALIINSRKKNNNNY